MSKIDENYVINEGGIHVRNVKLKKHYLYLEN